MANGIEKSCPGLALLGGLALLVSSCGQAPRSPEGSSLSVPAQISQWSFAGLPGTQLASRHYRIYTTTANHSLLRALPGFMESAYQHYLLLTGLDEPPTAPRPLALYVLASRQQWTVMTEQVAGPRSQTYLKIETGGYCHEGVCVLWDLGHFATFSVAAHEGFHQFCHYRLRDPLPAWAEEGLAVLAEGFNMTATTVAFASENNTLRQADLRRAISGGRWLPLPELLAADAADRVAGAADSSPEYYGQLWALMMFVRSQPPCRAGLERMIADAAAGRLRRELSIPAEMGTGRTYSRSVAMPLFEHYVDSDLAGFERRFRAYARTLAKLD